MKVFSKFIIPLLILNSLYLLAFSQDNYRYQEIEYKGIKTITPIGECNDSTEILEVMVKLKINTFNGIITGREFVLNNEDNEYTKNVNILWLGQVLSSKEMEFNNELNYTCNNLKKREFITFSNKVDCSSFGCNLILEDEYGLCEDNNCKYKVQYAISRKAQYPTSIQDNLIEEIESYQNKEELIGKFYAFDGKVVQKHIARKGKPYLQIELSKSSTEWIPSEKFVWVGLLYKLPEVKEGDDLRILASFDLVSEEDEVSKTHNQEGYLFLGMAVYNLISEDVTSFPAGMAIVDIWEKGNIPPDLGVSVKPDSFNMHNLDNQTKREYFSEIRSQYKTFLIKEIKAPQEYIEFTNPPENIKLVNYQSEGRELKGLLHTANIDSSKKTKAIVYLHDGFSLGYDALIDCQAFIDAGYVVFAPSYRGENGNEGYFEYLMGEVSDAENALEWLTKQSFIDSDNIFVFGHGTGGCISLVISLNNKAPSKLNGSSGGIYFDKTFKEMVDKENIPFNLSDGKEWANRNPLGMLKYLPKRHLMYIGSDDYHIYIKDIIQKQDPKNKIEINGVPGDKRSSLEPSIHKFIQEIEKLK